MEKEKKHGIWYAAALLGMILLVALDQLTKQMAVSHLAGKADIVLIPGVMKLHYLENRGAAFGMMQNQQWFFILLCFVFLALLSFVYVRMPKTAHYRLLAVLSVLVAAGGIGNLIDRIRLNYVVDFFCTIFIDFPVFNVADIYVTVSVILLAISLFTIYKDDDFSFLGKRRKTDGNVSI